MLESVPNTASVSDTGKEVELDNCPLRKYEVC